MKYDLKWLFQQISSGEPLSFLFFQDEKKKKNNKITKSCLSQLWESKFQEDGITYQTAVQWMMAEKARLFEDEKSLEAIINSDTPESAKKLGREVKGFDQQVWMDHRYDVVVKGNLLKFSQNDRLGQFLMDTDHQILVKANPDDRIWGIGMKVGERGLEAPKKWKGLNLLGFALMEVRDQLLENK